MKNQVLAKQKKSNLSEYLSNAVIEPFGGDTYTCFDYSTEDDYIYFDYNALTDTFTIGTCTFQVTDEFLEKLWDKFKQSDYYQTEEL